VTPLGAANRLPGADPLFLLFQWQLRGAVLPLVGQGINNRSAPTKPAMGRPAQCPVVGQNSRRLLRSGCPLIVSAVRPFCRVSATAFGVLLPLSRRWTTGSSWDRVPAGRGGLGVRFLSRRRPFLMGVSDGNRLSGVDRTRSRNCRGTVLERTDIRRGLSLSESDRRLTPLSTRR
jgi:hypothetical protein